MTTLHPARSRGCREGRVGIPESRLQNGDFLETSRPVLCPCITGTGDVGQPTTDWTCSPVVHNGEGTGRCARTLPATPAAPTWRAPPEASSVSACGT